MRNTLTICRVYCLSNSFFNTLFLFLNMELVVSIIICFFFKLSLFYNFVCIFTQWLFFPEQRLRYLSVSGKKLVSSCGTGIPVSRVFRTTIFWAGQVPEWFFLNNFACGVNLFYCFALINIYIHIFHSFRLMHATCALLRPTTSNSIETDKPDAYT